ncbi:Uu.00g065460.m01.CDS01 [Anthostomella pinea]|uniref:Uu.00g065460.m01.CDS01 n=1 Tax=Anthostomella pinea TaxID=933095 RepID=A0AAI8VTR3_9PEZI|nr:Uu.00g065460.m01.CDS01 [Anthostomella pinea]
MGRRKRQKSPSDDGEEDQPKKRPRATRQLRSSNRNINVATTDNVNVDVRDFAYEQPNPATRQRRRSNRNVKAADNDDDDNEDEDDVEKTGVADDRPDKSFPAINRKSLRSSNRNRNVATTDSGKAKTTDVTDDQPNKRVPATRQPRRSNRSIGAPVNCYGEYYGDAAAADVAEDQPKKRIPATRQRRKSNRNINVATDDSNNDDDSDNNDDSDNDEDSDDDDDGDNVKKTSVAYFQNRGEEPWAWTESGDTDIHYAAEKQFAHLAVALQEHAKPALNSPISPRAPIRSTLVVHVHGLGLGTIVNGTRTGFGAWVVYFGPGSPYNTRQTAKNLKHTGPMSDLEAKVRALELAADRLGSISKGKGRSSFAGIRWVIIVSDSSLVVHSVANPDVGLAGGIETARREAINAKLDRLVLGPKGGTKVSFSVTGWRSVGQRAARAYVKNIR